MVGLVIILLGQVYVAYISLLIWYSRVCDS